MSRSCPLVPGSLIPFYLLIQKMSHSNREEEEEGGCWLRKTSTGWRKEVTRQELVGIASVEGWGSEGGKKIPNTHQNNSPEGQPTL